MWICVSRHSSVCPVVCPRLPHILGSLLCVSFISVRVCYLSAGNLSLWKEFAAFFFAYQFFSFCFAWRAMNKVTLGHELLGDLNLSFHVVLLCQLIYATLQAELLFWTLRGNCSSGQLSSQPNSRKEGPDLKSPAALDCAHRLQVFCFQGLKWLRCQTFVREWKSEGPFVIWMWETGRASWNLCISTLNFKR